MTGASATEILRRIERTIVTDEIGMATARLGELVLAACYRPVLARTGEGFRLAAIQGEPAGHLGDRLLALGRPGDRVPEPDRIFMRAATAVLQARNRHLAGIGDLDLVIDFPAELADALVPFLRLLEPAASTPLLMDDEVGRLFLRLGAGFGADAAAAGRLAGSIGAHGLGALIDIPAFERIASELAELPGPLVVRIDATTLSRLTVESATGALFARLVEAFHGRGIRLLVDGIRDERGFHAALDAGADLLCGDFVGRGRLTGEAFDREPRPIGVRDRSGPFPSAHAERK